MSAAEDYTTRARFTWLVGCAPEPGHTHGEQMADTDKDSAHQQGGAAKRSEGTDTSKHAAGSTEAGQEANRGCIPEAHPTEHQSNYGGGGANGGADASKK